MNDFPNMLKEKLTSLIVKMKESFELFVKNPGIDFTRNRKLPFEDVIQLIISMGGNSIYKELLESHGYDVNTATTSAFVQQRAKILPSSFQFLLNVFTESHSDLKDYRGYRLLATDGSDLLIPTNPDDPETFCQNKPGENGYNLIHLNAMYDLCNNLYVDAVIQPNAGKNEGKALVEMVDRSQINSNTIVTADRGYESYNNFAHIEQKGWYYLIRVKDLDSSGILSGLDLPFEGEFDVQVNRILTRKQTKEIKARPDIYRYLNNKSTFDFLDLDTNLFYPISFRVVRLKITDDTYETIITNLPQSDFPPPELKKLYNLRWGIESSFRQLKYAVGLTNFHSKKRGFIDQEVFARLIMYNFAEMITFHVVISQSDTKHLYQVNFTVAILICKRLLLLLDHGPPLDVEALIRKNVLPVRPGRTFQRNIRPKKFVSFLYRVA